MKTVRVSEAVWDEIAKRGNFGETVDDVLRRVFKLDPSSESNPNFDQTASGQNSRRRRNKATNRMSAHISNRRLVVDFASGHRREFKLPDKSDKTGIRSTRDEACAFAEEHEATLGQVNAVKKALTGAGYYVSR